MGERTRGRHRQPHGNDGDSMAFFPMESLTILMKSLTMLMREDSRGLWCTVRTPREAIVGLRNAD